MTTTVPTGSTVPTGKAYDKYASSNPVERRLMRGFLDALDGSLPESPPGAVLEVGMGEGEVSLRRPLPWTMVRARSRAPTPTPPPRP